MLFSIEPVLQVFSCVAATVAHGIVAPAANDATPSTGGSLVPVAGLATETATELTAELASAELLAKSSAAPRREEVPQSIPNHPALSDRFYFGVGAGKYSTSTDARLDSPAGIGTSVSFEELLGLDESAWCPQLLGRWRFSERWRLEAEFFELNRSSSTKISGDITWNGTVFPVDTHVDATFNTSVTRVSCGYSFFKTQDKELGVALGFHLTDWDVSLEGSGGNAEGGAVLAPLPVLSGYGQFALTDRWALALRMDAFRIEYDDYAGHIYSMGLDVLYQPFRHLGFGLGYRGLDIELSMDSNDWTGEISTNYRGPVAFITTSF